MTLCGGHGRNGGTNAERNGTMVFGYRALRRSCVALAALATAAAPAFAGLMPAPESPADFGALQLAPLAEALNAPPAARAAIWPPAELGRFQPLADRDAHEKAVSDWAPTAVFVTLRASDAPEPGATALALALAHFVAREDGVNPLGQADWGGARAAIAAFYANRLFRPVWVDADGLTPAGRSAAATIERAGEDGLSLAATPLPRALAPPLDPEARAAAEVAIAAAVVAYAEQASGSRLSPARISPLFAAAPAVADPGAALAETAAAPDPGARLEAFNPPQKGYRALRDALARVKGGKTAADAGAALSDTPALSSDPLLGGASKARGPGSRRATRASAAPADGRRAAKSERAAILANMEMWRWEPRDMGVRRIEVNVPDFTVSVIDGDSVVMTSRVVVGKPDTPTPIFSDQMRYVLINPSWQVPESIIKKEISPRIGHFVRLGYEVKTIGGRLVVRQPPGAGNALGRLAFMFPNDHSVYLHDTPSRGLFAEDMRAFSHGCVRVEDPERLAEVVLDWPEARVQSAIGGPERTVFLPRPLPIHIEYFTRFVDADGVLQERPDVYGLAQKVAVTLPAASQD